MRWTLQQRLLILLITGILVGFGIWRMQQLPVDAFPDTTPVQVQINTVAPALNPAEIEQQITLPVELSISGLPGLSNVRSVSKFGFSQVVATFSDQTSIETARQYVFERISAVTLPPNINRPTLGPIATGLGEIFHYVVRSDSRSLEQLRTLHDWVIEPELRKVPGVAEVNAWGGEVRQYHVIVDPDALRGYNLTLNQVTGALRANNTNVGGGVITNAGVSHLVHGLGRVSSVGDIENIVVASYDGQPVLIRDVAQRVVIDHEIRRGSVTAGGQGEVVLGLGFMLMGENAQRVAAALKAQLDNVRQALPDDVEIDIVYDRTELTDAVMDTVQHNLALGALLVVGALLLFLGRLRAGLMVAVIIPLSLTFAVLGMAEFAIAASLLSLGAMDFGILIDGSVVMTDANLRSLRERSQTLGRQLTSAERLQTIIASSGEVARPIAFGMGIILIVFLPILTLEGVEGRLFKPMAWTFMFGLIGACLLALFLSPILSYYGLPTRYGTKRGWFETKLTHGYQAFLNGLIAIRYWVLTGVCLLLAATTWQALHLGGEFLPKLSEGSITLNTIRLAGISIDESNAYNTQIERIILEQFPDEVRQVWSRVGSAEVATDPMGTELTDIFITLTPRQQWTRASNQTELTAAIQAELADLPGLNMVATQPIEMRINEMVSGIRTDLGIKIYGDDFAELVRISDAIQRQLLNIAGAADIAVDQLTGQPTLQVRVDRQALARFGVPASQVLEYVDAIDGQVVGQVYEGIRHFDLVVRLPNNYRQDPDQLAKTIIRTDAGQTIPMERLADVAFVDGYATINREWGRRLIRVQCNVVGRDVTSFIAEAKQAIAENVALPTGYVVAWGGQFENLARANQRLMIVVPLTLLLVFILLFFSMKRLRDVLLIYTGIPFALVGGVWALWFRDIPFSISAAVGFIALSGLAVLDGQVLVTAIRHARQRGEGLARAIVAGGCRRLFPVLATSVTDALGFLPMAVSQGVGAEVQRPLATVVIGGMISSTLLTLVLLPLLYRMLHRDPVETSQTSTGTID